MENRFKAILTVVMMFIVGVVGPCASVTYATIENMDEEMLDMYAQNNILFYDPYGSNSCVDAGSDNYQVVDPSDYYYSADDNASAIMGTLMQNGYTQQSAAAILGNLYWESNLNPRVFEGGAIAPENFRAWDGGKTFEGGFGIVQWTYWSRVQALQEYADSRNLPVTSMQAQVGFLMVELPQYGLSPSDINSMSLHDAVYRVWRNYENPDTNDFDRRYNQAGAYLGISPSDLPDVAPAGEGDTGLGGSGEYVNCLSEDYGGPGSPVTVDGVVSYNQCDPEWGSLNYGNEGIHGHDMNSICDSGCGPTSFASILATMGMSVTPAETADVAGRAGMHVYCGDGSGNLCGSSNDITRVLAEHYGLSYQAVGHASVETISAALRSGKMVHAGGKGGLPFTSGGHFIAIVGITESGNWIVADSAGNHTPVAEYDPYQVVSSMGNAAIVGK